MHMVLGLCIGVGLSAACGFRVFVPMLATSVAAYSGRLQLADGFAWIGTPEAMTAFGVATALEVGAYYVPWLDNLLDSLATPAAVVAGTVITASCVVDMSPLLQWSLALIAGGGTAGVIQSTTSLIRMASTATTGGLANPVISSIEGIVALVLSALSMWMPILAICVVAVGLVVLFRFVRRFRTSPQQAESELAVDSASA